MAASSPTYADARLAVLNVLSHYRKETERSFGRQYVLEQAAKSLGQFGDQHGGRLVMTLEEQPAATALLKLAGARGLLTCPPPDSLPPSASLSLSS